MMSISGEIREQDFVLGQMTLEQEHMLAGKQLVIWQAVTNFWRSKIAKGKECYQALVGDIFTAGEKAEFVRQDKMLLSVPEMIPMLNALEGMQISGRKDGIIVAEGAEDSPDTEAANRIIKCIQSENQWGSESTAAFVDAMVTSYPSFVWFEKPTDWTGNKTLEMYHEPWDAVFPSPNYTRVDLSDCEEVWRVKAMSKDMAISRYPNRAKAIEDRVKEGKFNKDIFTLGSGFTADERNLVYSQIQESMNMFAKTGLVYVIERNHFILKEADIWISPDEQGAKLLPQDWTQEQVAEWQQTNPKFQMVHRKVRVLWVTACTHNAVMLENSSHWYQENEFPCEMYVPKTWDNKPYGIIEFLLGSNKMKNAARMEHLHSLRLANDGLMKVKEGAVKNAADLESEGGRVGGKIIIDKDFEMADVEQVPNKSANMGWAELSEMAQEDMNRIFVDKNFQGGTQSSQESGKAVQKRIDQTQLKQSPYINSYNYFDLRCIRKALRMLPYVLTKYQIFRYIDEKNQPQELEVNKPVDFDWQTGAATRLHNNLAGAKYDYREAQGDNSVTGKEHELMVFQEVLHNVLPGVDMQFWPFLLSSIPNRLANEFGRKIQAFIDAQANQPKTPEMKSSLNISGLDLLHNPLVQEIVKQAGLLPQAPQGGTGAPAPQAGQNQPAAPALQGVGQ